MCIADYTECEQLSTLNDIARLLHLVKFINDAVNSNPTQIYYLDFYDFITECALIIVSYVTVMSASDDCATIN